MSRLAMLALAASLGFTGAVATVAPADAHPLVRCHWHHHRQICHRVPHRHLVCRWNHHRRICRWVTH